MTGRIKVLGSCLMTADSHKRNETAIISSPRMSDSDNGKVICIDRSKTCRKYLRTDIFCKGEYDTPVKQTSYEKRDFCSKHISLRACMQWEATIQLLGKTVPHTCITRDLTLINYALCFMPTNIYATI